ncbi:MAG: acyltransferase [Flavipsychrobacter sp.]|nr:acyltransferase [Flavipsychrobacter sp.]
MKYVKGFDTLRALAVFYVILDHWGPHFKEHTVMGYVARTFLQSGLFGVNLFFVLSGFLITAILLNEKEKGHGENGLTIIKNFFVRRSLRIFPIYYLFIFLYSFANFDFIKDHLIYFLTYTSNILPYRSDATNELSHTWSLAVEEQFYIIWPWLVIFVNNKYLKYVFLAAIIVGVGSRYYVIFGLFHHYPVLVFNRIDSFAAGAVYAYMRLNEKREQRFQKVFLIALPLMLYLAWRIAPFSGTPVCFMYSTFVDSVIAVALIMFAIKNKNEWMRKYVLENTVFNFLGKISYGLYLYHFTLSASYDRLLAKCIQYYPDIPQVFTGAFFSYLMKYTILIIICWLSYKFIELPIMQYKNRFQYSKK